MHSKSDIHLRSVDAARIRQYPCVVLLVLHRSMKIESAEFSRRLAGSKEKSHYGAKLFECRTRFSEGSVAIRFQERDGGGRGPGLLRKKASGARGGARRAAVHSALLPYTCNVVWGAAARAQGWWMGDIVPPVQYWSHSLSHAHTHSLTPRILSHALSSQACAYCFKERIFSPPVWRSHTHTNSAQTHPLTQVQGSRRRCLEPRLGGNAPSNDFQHPVMLPRAPPIILLMYTLKCWNTAALIFQHKFDCVARKFRCGVSARSLFQK